MTALQADTPWRKHEPAEAVLDDGFELVDDCNDVLVLTVGAAPPFRTAVSAAFRATSLYTSFAVILRRSGRVLVPFYTSTSSARVTSWGPTCTKQLLH
jgi:predicted methyltransferase